LPESYKKILLLRLNQHLLLNQQLVHRQQHLVHHRQQSHKGLHTIQKKLPQIRQQRIKQMQTNAMPT
jgi:hypothetical protein